LDPDLLELMGRHSEHIPEHHHMIVAKHHPQMVHKAHLDHDLPHVTGMAADIAAGKATGTESATIASTNSTILIATTIQSPTTSSSPPTVQSTPVNS
jgi:hypothetical protein